MALRSSDAASEPDNTGTMEKMTSFSMIRKKTPFQKHREEEEAKKKRADEEAARLYEEFVESFKADDTPGGKAFVRGGTINPSERSKPDTESLPRGRDVEHDNKYVPSFLPPGLAAMVNKEKEPEKGRDDERSKDRERGKSRNIDHFMEELKREQEAREKRTADREQRRSDRKSQAAGMLDLTPYQADEVLDDDKLPGSFDDVDPQTTNLYVGNLAPQVDENFLLRTFGRFGPIASVKIMWPRTDEERRRQRNCGFVAFMDRDEAQAARDEMQGVIVYDYELRIGWGKAVSLPAQALPAPPPGQMAIRAKEGATVSNVAWSGRAAPSPQSVSGQNSEVVVTPNVPDIQVIPPEDEHLRHIIDTTAMYVLDDGCTFEQAVMERGRGNPLFNFLFDLTSKEHTYYIWRLYSFAQGDTLQRWRTEPFIMITGSGRWISPPLPPQESIRSPDQEKAMAATTFAAGKGRRIDQERTLTEGQRDEFEDMLRALTLERSQIREAMGFALNNSEAAGEVVEVLTESLTLKETPIPTKVARLMLVSDVLHNSSAPVKNASAYRTGFEAWLPDIMESFNDLYRNITGRITAEALKERVLKVLQVWADWFLFSDAFVNGLRSTFLRPGNSGVPPFYTLNGDAEPTKENGGESNGREIASSVPDNLDGDIGQDAALAMGEGAAARELASLPLAELERRCRHNGLSTRGGIEVMVARLLGLEEAEKLKNQEQEEELKASQGYMSGGETPSNRSSAAYSSGHVATWPHYQGDKTVTKESGGPREAGPGNVSLPQTLAIPQPEHKAFGGKVGKHEPVLPASKWTREDDISDDDDQGNVKGLALGYSSSGSDELFGRIMKLEKVESGIDNALGVANDTSMDEERRQKLRRLEVAVMEYRVSLEERGIKSPEEIDKKVALLRKKLEADFGFVDGQWLPGQDRDTKALDSSRLPERGTWERRERWDEKRESTSSRKRTRSRSRSPPRAKERLTRERERDREREERVRSREEHDRDRWKDSDHDRIRDWDRERDQDREKRNRRS
ncbi:unnamed protein product [Sphagnum balticum]